MDPSVIFYQLASVIALGVALVAAVNLFWGTDIALAESDAENQLEEFVNHIDDFACQGEQVRSGFLPPESFRVSEYDFNNYETIRLSGANTLVAEIPASDNDIEITADCEEINICDTSVPIEDCTSDHNVEINDPGQIGFRFHFNPSGEETVNLQRQAQVDEEGPFVIYVNDSIEPQIKAVSLSSGDLYDFYYIRDPQDPRSWYQGSNVGETGDLGQGHANSVLIGNETNLFRIDTASIGSQPVDIEIEGLATYSIFDIGGIGDVIGDTGSIDTIVIDQNVTEQDFNLPVEDGTRGDQSTQTIDYRPAYTIPSLDDYDYNICGVNIPDSLWQCTNLSQQESVDDLGDSVYVGAVVNVGMGPEATFIEEYDHHLYLWDGESVRNKTISNFKTCEHQDVYDYEDNDDISPRNVSIKDIGGTVNADYGFGYDDEDLVAILESADGTYKLGYIKLHGQCAFTARTFDDVVDGAGKVGYPGENRIPYLKTTGEMRRYHLLEENDASVEANGSNVEAEDISSIVPNLNP